MTREDKMRDDDDLLAAGLSPAELSELLQASAPASTAAPSAARRLALLAATQRPILAYAERVARLAQMTLDDAKALLQRRVGGPGWEPGPEPGIFFLEVNAGPALAGAVVGLVAVPADSGFPEHEHIGEELVLVLSGGIVDDTGRQYEAGDLVTAQAGSQHSFRSAPGEDLLYLSVIQEGVDFAPSGGPKIVPRGR